MKERGRWLDSPRAPKTMATVPLSAVLGGEDDAAQARFYGMLVEDLRRVAGRWASGRTIARWGWDGRPDSRRPRRGPGA